MTLATPGGVAGVWSWGMLLWINGPFGGGKTRTAHEIQRRLAGSVVWQGGHMTRRGRVIAWARAGRPVTAGLRTSLRALVRHSGSQPELSNQYTRSIRPHKFAHRAPFRAAVGQAMTRIHGRQTPRIALTAARATAVDALAAEPAVPEIRPVMFNQCCATVELGLASSGRRPPPAPLPPIHLSMITHLPGNRKLQRPGGEKR